MVLIDRAPSTGTLPDPPSHSRPRPSSRVSERTVLLVASFGALLAFLDVTIVNVAFPSIQASFAASSIGAISWVLNAYNIVFAAFLIVFGRLADLVGRRRLYLAGIGLFTLASMVCALSPSVIVLVGARILQALGAAMLVPASLALVIEGFPRPKRPHAVGLWGAAAAVAAGLGPPIGGAVVEAGGWQWAFWVNLPLGIVALWLGRRHLVESRAPGRRRIPDLMGALLLAGALGLLTSAIIKSPDWGLRSPLLWAVAAGAVAVFAGFVASSRRHPSPVIDLAMVRSRPFVVANIATLVAGVGFFAYMLTNVLWLQYVWRYSVLEAGLALAPAAIVAAVVASLLGPVAARHGYQWVIAAGFIVWGLGFVWYVRMVGTSPDFLRHWLPGQVLSGIGVGATMPLLGSATLATQPGGRFGTASAVISSARQVGGTIGLALLVVILGTPSPSTIVGVLRDGWTMSMVCFLVGAAITPLMGRVSGPADDPDLPDAGNVRLHPPTASPDAVMSRAVPPVEESLFGRLPESTRQRISDAAPRRLTHAGDWLVRTGESADSLFVLISGRAEVLIGDEVVRELGPGAVIGELALLTDGVRSASVRARRDCISLEVSRALMDDTIGADPGALSALVTALAGQLADARPPVREAVRPSLVAVIAATSGAPAEAVGAALHRGLSQHLRVAFFPGQASSEEVDRAEIDHERVIVVANGADAAWSARCAREADAVILVARAGEPVPSDLHAWASRPELVLVGGSVSGHDASGWSAVLDPWRITRVPDPGSDDVELTRGLERLVDRLAGRSVALVLGGGGARAFSHIGVLLELEAAGIRVDRVAGASVGSVIAGLYALGGGAEQVSDTVYREFVRERPLGDYGVPRTSLARGQRIRRAIVRSFGDHLIEELPLGFRCVSTDLISRTSVVHRTGPIGDAVNASVQLPILLPPIPRDGRLLVDGGVLNNLPVDTVTERDEGPVIAVNVTMGGRSTGQKRTGQEPTRPVRVPPLGETLLRTLMIGGGEVARAHELGAWVVTPDSMGVGLLEFHQFDRMVESGRAAARSLLEQTGGDLFAAGVRGA